MLSVIDNPISVLAMAFSEKMKTHMKYISNNGILAKRLPLLLSALGDWHPNSHTYPQTVADEEAARLAIPLRTSRALLLQRNTALLIHHKARCLTEKRVNSDQQELADVTTGSK